MKFVELKTSLSSIPFGRSGVISSIFLRTASATATAFVPRCLMMPMPTARSPWKREMRRTSLRPSSHACRRRRSGFSARRLPPRTRARDQEARELFGRVGLAVHANVVLLVARVHVAGGHVRVLGVDRAEHVLDGDLALGHLLRVEPHPQVRVDVAAERDVAHARHHRHLVAQVLVDVAADVRKGGGRAGRRAQGEPDDGLVLGIDLLDDRRVDVLGQVLLRLRDVARDVLHRGVDAAAQVELDRDRRRAQARDGGDVGDAFDAGDRVLDDVGDLGLHDVRRRVLPVHRHGDDREVDVGQLADAHAVEADPPEHEQAQHQHPGEDGVADREVGKAHFALSGPPAATSSRTRA